MLSAWVSLSLYTGDCLFCSQRTAIHLAMISGWAVCKLPTLTLLLNATITLKIYGDGWENAIISSLAGLCVCILMACDISELMSQYHSSHKGNITDPIKCKSHALRGMLFLLCNVNCLFIYMFTAIFVRLLSLLAPDMRLPQTYLICSRLAQHKFRALVFHFISRPHLTNDLSSYLDLPLCAICCGTIEYLLAFKYTITLYFKPR